MTSIVTLENISKGFRDGESFHPVLQQVSLTLQQGQTIALTGPSGSGKSTLLNIIGGFETIDNGDMLIRQGDNMLSVTQWQDKQWSQYRRRSLGVIFQHFNLLTPLNVRDNIQFSLALKQRVAIARALAHKPQLILADEPTGNLDQHAGMQVMQLLTELAQQANCCILMVTHSEECAAFMQHRWHVENQQIVVNPTNKKLQG